MILNILKNLFKKLKINKVHQYVSLLLFCIALILYSTTGFMYFELEANPDLTWNDSLWWSLVTMTTVGYGDFFPVTIMGRLLVGVPTIIFGVSILGYVLSIVASSLIESKMKEVRGMKNIKIKNHIIICHYSSPSRIDKLINELRKDSLTKKSPIVLIDEHLESLPSELVSAGVLFVKGDPSREKVLQQANLTEAKSVIVQCLVNDKENSDNHNLKIALTVEVLKPEVYTVIECTNPENIDFFKRAGCDSVVCISSLTSQMLVQELLDPGVGTIVSELTSNTHGKQFYLIDIPTSCNEFGTMADYFTKDVQFIGIRRGRTNHLLPGSSFSIQENDKAIVIATERPL